MFNTNMPVKMGLDVKQIATEFMFSQKVPVASLLLHTKSTKKSIQGKLDILGILLPHPTAKLKQ